MTKEVLFSPSARKYLKKLKDKVLLQSLFGKIEQIADNPYEVGEPKTGDLAGIYGVDVKYRGGNYEIAYTMRENADGKLVIIIMVGTREQFYEKLKVYLK